MRQQIAEWLNELADWLDPVPPGGFLMLPVKLDALFDAAKELVEQIDVQDQTGEWKRHQVYAQLLKAFPERGKRAVALAIEAALSR